MHMGRSRNGNQYCLLTSIKCIYFGFTVKLLMCLWYLCIYVYVCVTPMLWLQGL